MSLDLPIEETGTIKRLTEVLVQAARPKFVIPFGSYARGDAIEENAENRVEEMMRLSRLVRSPNIAVDLLVVSLEKFLYWRETPGNVNFEAATEGRILYEAA